MNKQIGDCTTNFAPVSFGLRVRYFETDQMGVVHHAHYPIWFEAARSEYCRIHGIDYIGMERDGLLLPVVALQARYLSPARYDDDLTVNAWLVEIKRSVLIMGYEVTRGTTVLATGETTQMLIDRESGKPRRFADEIASRFAGVSPDEGAMIAAERGPDRQDEASARETQ